MRIGVITNIFDAWGGSEELWAEMAAVALDNGHEVIVTFYHSGIIHPKMQALINRGCICIGRRGYVKPGRKMLRRIFLKAKILVLNYCNNPYKKFFSYNPDIVLHNGSSYQFAEDRFFFKTIKKCKNLFVLNHIIPDNTRNISDATRQQAIYLLKLSKKVFFVSERSLKTAERQLVYKITNAEIVRNPVNIKKPEYLLYPATEYPSFALVANLLVNHKGQDILLEALSNQSWKNENWALEIFGSGVDEKYIQELIYYYGLNDKVKLAGKTNDIKSVWLSHHFLIMPSLMEGTPLAMVEAMLCGRPVLITDVGGTTEWIKDGENGFVIEGPNVNSISKALEKMWNEKKNWKQMGINAHKRAIELYDPAAGKTLLEKILK